jgi:nucleoside-diphosphate-sugar epimerase
MATEHFDGEEPVNLGTNYEISLKELVELLAELMEFEGKIHWQTDKPKPRVWTSSITFCKSADYWHPAIVHRSEESIDRYRPKLRLLKGHP